MSFSRLARTHRYYPGATYSFRVSERFGPIIYQERGGFLIDTVAFIIASWSLSAKLHVRYVWPPASHGRHKTAKNSFVFQKLNAK